MKLYTQENWFKWGYDHKHFAFRTSEDEKLTIDFGLRARRPTTSFFEESILAAQEIYETYGAPTIQYSGGLDSEMIVSAFRHAGVPFKCQTLRYTGGINDHDVRYAVSYCEAHGIKQDFYDIDAVKFIQSDEAQEIAWQCQTKQVVYTIFFKALRESGEFCIHGGGEPVVEWQLPSQDAANRLYKRRWVAWEHERYYSPLKFMIANDLDSLPCFYHYTPELWTSFFKNKYIQRLVRNQYAKHINKSDDLKHQTNEGHNPEKRLKYNGFERVLDQVWERCNQINNAAPHNYGDDWTMPYSEVLEKMDYRS